MRRIVLALVLVIAALGGWYLASPWLAMKGLADAAQANDTAALERRIDFPALRASASDQVTRAVRAQDGHGGLIDMVGGAVAERLGREVLNRALTPAGIGSVIATGAFAAPLLPERLRGQEIGWEVERQGLDHFRGVGTFEDGTPGPVLIFARDGIGWKLTGFELP